MMNKEIWVPILGWEEYYEISNQGRVRTLPGPGRRRKQSKLRKPDIDRGYPKIGLFAKGRKTRRAFIHRLMLESFTRQRGKGLDAAHRDGDPKNCTLENIYWASRLENMHDRIRHGKIPLGTDHKGAKLNEDKVKAIRLALFRDGVDVSTLARRFKVAYATITAIRDGRTWRHIPSSFYGEAEE